MENSHSAIFTVKKLTIGSSRLVISLKRNISFLLVVVFKIRHCNIAKGCATCTNTSCKNIHAHRFCSAWSSKCAAQETVAKCVVRRCESAVIIIMMMIIIIIMQVRLFFV